MPVAPAFPVNKPYIIEETCDFAVVFKPPKMHCAPLLSASQKDSGTLFEWYVSRQAALNISLVHRLDYETHGLVLFAKNPNSFNFFKSLQDNGGFIKEYSAVCKNTGTVFAGTGYPPPPVALELLTQKSFCIESYFRPYGPGRKLVRPVTENCKKNKKIAKDKDGYYQTEVINISGDIFTVRLKRGFRHQIRCHLGWIGRPILNDPLYPQPAKKIFNNSLALRAHSLFFTCPDGSKKKYRINELYE